MANDDETWTMERGLAVVLLLWNLIGIAAFVMQWTQDIHALARTDPYQAQAFASMPSWAWASYAVAVTTGLLGALLLVMRRKGAVVLSAIEVIAVIVQFSYTFLMTDLLAQKGASTVIFPLVIFLLALFQFGLARRMDAKAMLA